MFWNDPEHCFKRIILIKDEDDILSNPKQIQVYLPWAKLINHLGYTAYTLYYVHSVHTVQITQCTHCTMYTVYTLYNVHTVQCSMYTLYKPTAGNQFSYIVYTRYS
jgi:hypothetical protein